MADSMEKKKKPSGLEGVVAGETAIATVDKDGKDLRYRGYTVRELAEHSSFEEVAYLMIYGELPTQAQLDQYKKKLVQMRELPEALKHILEQIPARAHPMAVLRTGCSALGTMELEAPDKSNQIDIANRLVASFPSMLLYWYHFVKDGKRIDTRGEEDTMAGHFLRMLHGKEPDPDVRRMLDVSLMLYAEHGFNASTFTALVIASTLSDMYSAVSGAIGALRGPLHGGANEEALKMVKRFKSPDEAEKWVLEALAKKVKIMGFGHRVYKISDPRAIIMKSWAKKLAEKKGDTLYYEIADRIEQVMKREKNLFPNVDFPCGITYYYADIPPEMYTPLFAMARVTGWAAHIIEQRANNRIYRPLAKYVGPEPRPYVPISQRG